MRMLAVALAGLLFAGVAVAESGTAKERARALLQQGNRLTLERDYARALVAFREAYAAFPSPKIVLNIGTTLRLLGRSAEAAETYERYLADPQSEPARRAEVEQVLRQLDARLGRLRITVHPPGARVLIDGQPAGAATPPVVRRLEPGDHTVTATAEGCEDGTIGVKVMAGDERPLELRLRPRDVAASNRRPAATQPRGGPGTPPPARVVTVARALPPMTVPVAPHRGVRPPRWAPWVALAAAVIAAGMGTYFAQGAFADPEYGSARQAALGANVSFAVAGVAVLSAGGLWLWQRQ